MAEAGKVMGGSTQNTQQKTRAQYVAPSMNIKPNKHATEAGMTPAEAKTLLDEEARFARSYGGRYEIAGVVDAQGRLNPRGNPMVGERTGREALHGSTTTVRTRKDRTSGDMHFTHFHPWDDRGGSGLGKSVGISISGPDIANTIERGNRSIRARSQGYIYSIRRPAGGWNANPQEVRSDWNRVYQREVNSMKDTIRRIKEAHGLTWDELMVRQGRLNALASHRATKAIADKYGFIYTRRKAK